MKCYLVISNKLNKLKIFFLQKINQKILVDKNEKKLNYIGRRFRSFFKYLSKKIKLQIININIYNCIILNLEKTLRFHFKNSFSLIKQRLIHKIMRLEFVGSNKLRIRFI